MGKIQDQGLAKAMPKLMDAANKWTGHERDELTALVRSGQYFAVVATELDKLSLEVSGPQSEMHKNRLQKLVDELLYVQQNYKIKKRGKF